MILSQTSQFKKDIKRLGKRGKDIGKVKAVLDLLMAGAPLPPKYKDHALSGTWAAHRDCHIEPDWILIYRISPDELRLERTGSHSDLF